MKAEQTIQLDQATRLASRSTGIGMIALSAWGTYSDSDTSLLWSLAWAALGCGVALLYAPVLRFAAFGFLVLAGVTILGGLSPFAAMDLAPRTREAPGFQARHIAVVLGASLIFSLLAFCLAWARRSVLAQRTAALNPPQTATPTPPRSAPRP